MVLLLALGAWSLTVGLTDRGPGYGPLPDFRAIERVEARKQAFFDYLTPIVRAENLRIEARRDDLLAIVRQRENNQPLSWSERRVVADLAGSYELEPDTPVDDLLAALLERVDVIPRSLVLVQAAKESGWGRSRFARQANNLFGHWCFDQGCGLVPANRAPGRKHEVRRFSSARHSVASYMHNLNTHPSYDRFRQIRAASREQNAELSGVKLAAGLTRYSERGKSYVREVQSMIRRNQLDQSAVGE